jgi:spermidine/putrescine transport system permease protein
MATDPMTSWNSMLERSALMQVPVAVRPSASREPGAPTQDMGRGLLWRRRLPALLVEVWLRAHSALLYLFLYAPIAVVVIFAFNNSRRVTIWNGFTTKWFGVVWTDPTWSNALRVSMTVASLNMVIAVTLGTLAALGMRAAPGWLRTGFEGIVYMTIITPEIVVAVASLLYFVLVLPIGQGIQAMVVTHAVYNTSIVALIVSARLAGMDNTLEEASADLGAPPLATFWRVTLPQLFPAILAGALLAFTFSFDDFILSNFLAAAGTTPLPVQLFSSVQFGVSPAYNALAASMLCVTLTAIVVAQVVLRQGTLRARRARRGEATEGADDA